MKQIKLILALAALMTIATTGFSQGAINFASFGTGAGSTSVNAPITNWNGALASGSGFFVQLYAGSNALSLSPVGSPVAMSGSPFLGYFFGNSQTISGFAIGSTPVLVVRAWENAGGTITNYFDALGSGHAFGESSPITSPALGDPFNPSTLPVMQGLNGFALVPEPSVTALVAVGALGIFLRARRKI